MEYRTQKQFDELCLRLINGNFSQAVAQYVEYGFNAQDLRVMVDNTQWLHDNPYFSSEDFYQVIESASKMSYIYYKDVESVISRLTEITKDKCSTPRDIIEAHELRSKLQKISS